MTLRKNGYTVSGRFPAKKSIGTCPQCKQGLVTGQPSVFVKALMGSDGRAVDTLGTGQRREYSRLYRQAQELGHQQGILPRMTKYGRLARTQRPVSLQEVGIAPSWLFDHMIHWDCLPVFAGGASVRDIAGYVGSRSEGMAHGVALTPSVTPTTPATGVATVTPPKVTPKVTPKVEPPEVTPKVTPKVEPPEASPDLVADILAATLGQPDQPLYGDGDFDPSVERFKRLDLD